MNGVGIGAEGLCKAPGAASPGVAALDLAVAGGECVGLAGPVAATATVIALLAGDLPADGGRVRLLHGGEAVVLDPADAGRQAAIRRFTVAALRHGGGRIPDGLGALDAVVAPALAIGRCRGVARDAAARLLATLGLGAAQWAVPVGRLRAADRRRVAVARAFVAEWPVLLLDRPTAGLDAATADAVRRLIGQARQRGSAVVGRFDRGVATDRTVAVRLVWPAGNTDCAIAKNPARKSAAIW